MQKRNIYIHVVYWNDDNGLAIVVRSFRKSCNGLVGSKSGYHNVVGECFVVCTIQWSLNAA